MRRIGADETAPEVARTRTGKIFQLGQNKFRWMSTIGPVHVPTDFEAWKRGDPVDWEDPDLTIEPNQRGRLSIRKGYFELEVMPNDIGYTYQSKLGGFVSVRLVEIDGQPVGSVPNPRIDDSRIWWDAVRPDLDMYMEVGLIKLEIWKRLNSDAAPRSYTWEIEESDPPILDLKILTQGQDNDERLEPSRTGLGPGWAKRWVELLHSQTPFSTPRPSIRRYRVTETWTGRTFRYERTPERAKEFFDDVVYPVLIDQDVSETIVADGDDGQETGTTWANSYGAATKHLIWSFGGARPGYRFQTVAIPNAATIDAATFTVYVFDLVDVASTGILAGNDVDDAPAWASSAGPNDMTATTASVNPWTVPDATGAFASSVTAIIQEIVNRAGWVSGNDLALGVKGAQEGGYKYITDFGNGSNIATLTVDYTAAGGSAAAALLLLMPNLQGNLHGRMSGNLQ